MGARGCETWWINFLSLEDKKRIFLILENNEIQGLKQKIYWEKKNCLKFKREMDH